VDKLNIVERVKRMDFVLGRLLVRKETPFILLLQLLALECALDALLFDHFDDIVEPFGKQNRILPSRRLTEVFSRL